MKYLLDTHAWIWMHIESQKLSRPAKQLLSKPGISKLLSLSAISIVELGTLINKGRLSLNVDFNQWVEISTISKGIHIIPVSAEIATEAAQLPGPFHYDPADRIIAATARIDSSTIITADHQLREYRHIRTLW